MPKITQVNEKIRKPKAMLRITKSNSGIESRACKLSLAVARSVSGATRTGRLGRRPPRRRERPSTPTSTAAAARRRRPAAILHNGVPLRFCRCSFHSLLPLLPLPWSTTWALQGCRWGLLRPPNCEIRAPLPRICSLLVRAGLGARVRRPARCGPWRSPGSSAGLPARMLAAR
jgi:hypothetical protein